MSKLTDQLNRCHLCPFSFSRRNVVPYAGSLAASVALIGEAPGRDEDEAGEAFVGAAGKDMTNTMADFGLRRDHFFICNILKCRPKRPFAQRDNETPRQEWADNCFPYLWGQINIIRPKLIVLVGMTAARNVLNLPYHATMGKLAGSREKISGFKDYEVDWDLEYAIMYHPAALMRPQKPDEKAKKVKNIRDTFHYVRAQI